MQSYVYQTSMKYQSSTKLLTAVRSVVSHLKRVNPELNQCTLADVSLKKGPDDINVTLFFEEK